MESRNPLGWVEASIAQLSFVGPTCRIVIGSTLHAKLNIAAGQISYVLSMFTHGKATKKTTSRAPTKHARRAGAQSDRDAEGDTERDGARSAGQPGPRSVRTVRAEQQNVRQSHEETLNAIS